jgi:hypothetical protein
MAVELGTLQFAPRRERGGEEGGDMSEESLEAPEADAAEQQAEAVAPDDVVDDDADDDEAEDEAVSVPLEADPADAAEQARMVRGVDDEDYR